MFSNSIHAAYAASSQMAEKAKDSNINPLDGVKPNFKLLGVEFENAFQGILAGVWGFCIAVVVLFLLINTAKWGIARQQGRQDDLEDGMTGMKRSGVALGCLAAAGIIVGAIFAIVS